MDVAYSIKEVDTVDTPALVLYYDKIIENIDRMISIAGDPNRLRPHVKTYKIAEVAKLMQSKGISKFKCATIAEAEMLGMIEAEDVLLAFQPIGPKIKRLIKLQKKYTKTIFSTLIDNRESAQEIANLCRAMNATLYVFVDLNVGMNRTGVIPNEEAFDLYDICDKIEGINPIGLHAYDGHIRNTDIIERTKHCDAAYQPVADLAARIKKITGRQPYIVVGGTPSFSIHANRKGVQLSPGTCVLWDHGYKTILPEQKYVYGALVLARVISQLPDNQLCLDLGHKSIAAENPFPRVKFLNLPNAKEVSQSEEHLVISVPDAALIPVGSVLYGVPIHICPTCALYERALIVSDNIITDEWKVVARDRKITV
jgi:D-serine deaminase-like pyridoxal phosphate-dependent protein